MLRRTLLPFLAVVTLVASIGATPAFARDASELLPLCSEARHNCGTTVGTEDARIVGRHFGHNIGTTLGDGDIDAILMKAEKRRQARAAAERRALSDALMPLCREARHHCGTTVGTEDARIVGRHFGHNIGTTLGQGDVDAILEKRERRRQARAQRTTVWDRLARCESGGNWSSTVGRYEGGLQFHPSTWDANRPSSYPSAAFRASRSQQIRVAERVLNSQGWGAWPACARQLGLR